MMFNNFNQYIIGNIQPNKATILTKNLNKNPVFPVSSATNQNKFGIKHDIDINISKVFIVLFFKLVKYLYFDYKQHSKLVVLFFLVLNIYQYPKFQNVFNFYRLCIWIYF